MPNDTNQSKLPAPSGVQPPPDHHGTSENGPFNPPDEFVQVTRRKRGSGLAYIVNGKRTDEQNS